MPVNEQTQRVLVIVHDSSGSKAVANAMKFRAGHEDARPDVSAALQQMAFVPKAWPWARPWPNCGFMVQAWAGRSWRRSGR